MLKRLRQDQSTSSRAQFQDAFKYLTTSPINKLSSMSNLNPFVQCYSPFSLTFESQAQSIFVVTGVLPVEFNPQ